MTIDEIRRRLISLQNQINALSTLLPENAQVEFGAVDFTKSTDVAERKRLVITVTEIQSRIGIELIERVKNKR
ncbi:MAG: hypothetical protein JWQ21_2207 [Herminiimonas sp.]|nr:hypothetical protein [Herminiimonas sp.]